MYKTGSLLAIIAFMCSVSCGRQQDKNGAEFDELFPISATASVHLLGSLSGEPKSMDYVTAWDGKIVLGSKRNDPVLNIYDIASLQLVDSSFRRGNGPIDISYLGNFCADSQTLFIYDMNVGKQLRIPTGATINRPTVHTMPGRDPAVRFMNIVPLWGNRFVADGRLDHDDSQFCLLDSSGRITSYLDTYPQNEANKDFPSYDKAFGFQGQIFPTYDGKRFVYASRSGLVLKFFGMGPTGEFEKVNEFSVQIPNFTPQSNPAQGFYTVAGDADNLRGVASMTADRQFYYFLFSGKTLREDMYAGPVDQLLVFTHSGEPVARIRLDRAVNRIVYDASTAKLYALTMDETANLLSEISLPVLSLPN